MKNKLFLLKKTIQGLKKLKYSITQKKNKLKKILIGRSHLHARGSQDLLSRATLNLKNKRAHGSHFADL